MLLQKICKLEIVHALLQRVSGFEFRTMDLMHTARLFIPRRNHGTTRVDAKQLFYVLSVCQAEDSDSGSDARFSHHDHSHLSCSLALCALYASSFCQASFCGSGVGPGTPTGLRFLFFNSLDNTIR